MENRVVVFWMRIVVSLKYNNNFKISYFDLGLRNSCSTCVYIPSKLCRDTVYVVVFILSTFVGIHIYINRKYMNRMLLMHFNRQSN